MTYETPVIQEIGNAEELTLGCVCGDACDCEGTYKNGVDNQY